MKSIDQYKKHIEVFNNHNVEYMIVGAFSVNFHGYVRATMDMDIWVGKSEKNLVRLYDSFVSLGFDKLMCKEAIKHFRDQHMIKISLEETKIDILDSFMMKGDFDSCHNNRVTGKIAGVKTHIIGMDDLIKCKKKSNRMKDLVDAKNLEALKDPKKLNESGSDDIFSLER